MKQKGCSSNRPLTVPKPINPSEEDTMTNRFALVIAALASLSCTSAIAQAATNPAATALPPVTVDAPDYTRYDMVVKHCLFRAVNLKAPYRVSDAHWFNGMNPDKFQAFIERCKVEETPEKFALYQKKHGAKSAAQTPAPLAAATEASEEGEVVEPNREDTDMPIVEASGYGRRPPPQHHGRGHGGDNYAEVRRALQAYDGPLWNTQGPIRNRFMNKRAPSTAVPCKPPGYNHIVLCNPR